MGSIFSRCRSTNSTCKLPNYSPKVLNLVLDADTCKLTDYFPKALAQSVQDATTIIPKLCHHNDALVILTNVGYVHIRGLCLPRLVRTGNISDNEVILTHVIDIVSSMDRCVLLMVRTDGTVYYMTNDRSNIASLERGVTVPRLIPYLVDIVGVSCYFDYVTCSTTELVSLDINGYVIVCNSRFESPIDGYQVVQVNYDVTGNVQMLDKTGKVTLRTTCLNTAHEHKSKPDNIQLLLNDNSYLTVDGFFLLNKYKLDVYRTTAKIIQSTSSYILTKTGDVYRLDRDVVKYIMSDVVAMCSNRPVCLTTENKIIDLFSVEITNKTDKVGCPIKYIKTDTVICYANTL